MERKTKLCRKYWRISLTGLVITTGAFTAFASSLTAHMPQLWRRSHIVTFPWWRKARVAKRPNEKIFRDMSEIIRQCKKVREGLVDTRHILDPLGMVASRCDNLITEAEIGLSKIANELAKERKAIVIAERKKDQWASPSCASGWLCPDSPTGACEYENGDPDDCDHCGFPEERK